MTRAGLKEIKYQDDGTFAVNMGKPVFLIMIFQKIFRIGGSKIRLCVYGKSSCSGFCGRFK